MAIGLETAKVFEASRRSVSRPGQMRLIFLAQHVSKPLAKPSSFTMIVHTRMSLGCTHLPWIID